MPPPAQHSTSQSADEHLGAGGRNINLATSQTDRPINFLAGIIKRVDPTARHMPRVRQSSSGSAGCVLVTHTQMPFIDVDLFTICAVAIAAVLILTIILMSR